VTGKDRRGIDPIPYHHQQDVNNLTRAGLTVHLFLKVLKSSLPGVSRF
jgi:hypothetical protein